MLHYSDLTLTYVASVNAHPCIICCTVPSEVSNVVISVISNSSILVQWGPPTHPNGVLTYYDVIVFNILTKFNVSAQINVSDTRQMIVTEMGKLFLLTYH